MQEILSAAVVVVELMQLVQLQGLLLGVEHLTADQVQLLQ